MAAARKEGVDPRQPIVTTQGNHQRNWVKHGAGGNHPHHNSEETGDDEDQAPAELGQKVGGDEFTDDAA